MTYWLDLFTGTTWDEFRQARATITGFRVSQRSGAKRVKPGDIFLCYLADVTRWVGALEVVGCHGAKQDLLRGVPVRPLPRPWAGHFVESVVTGMVHRSVQHCSLLGTHEPCNGACCDQAVDQILSPR